MRIIHGMTQLVREANRSARARLRTYDPLNYLNRVLSALGAGKLSAAQHKVLFDEITHHPVLAERYGEAHRTVTRLGMTGRSDHEYKNYWKEFRWRSPTSIAMRDIVYVLTRVLRPGLIVETGVASGGTSSFFLAALAANQYGHLHSIDVPPVAGKACMSWTATENSPVGFLVPDTLKDRWTLTVRDSTYALPTLFEGKTIDLFMHDSDHSRAHMLYEYAFADKHLKRPGLLLSDDILANNAFLSYFDREQTFIHRNNPNIGAVVLT